MPEFAAHDQLFLDICQDLSRVLRRRLDAHSVQDIIHDTFLRWRGEVDTQVRNPRAFLVTVALNLARDQVRSDIWQRNRRVALDDVEDWCSDSASPEEGFAGRQRLDRLIAALAELPLPVRNAFLLHRFDGLTQVEIGRQLGLSKRTVERYLQRAIEHCLAALAG